MSDKCKFKDRIRTYCKEAASDLPSIDDNYCRFCGEFIRDTETLTCNSECGMRMKYGVSCAIHDCKHIRKPEPAEPLIVKSGKTWVAHWEGVDYLSTTNELVGTVGDKTALFLMQIKQGVWKSFTGSDPDIVKLTDEIAKLRPMVENSGGDYDILYGVIGENYLIWDSSTERVHGMYDCHLATARELSQAQK